MATILLVENHTVFAQTVCKEFLSGYAVDIVPSIEKALEAVSKKSYDCVLVDYDLDDGKGDILVPLIRSQYPNIKIVAMSSHDIGNNAILVAGAHVACSKMKFKNINLVLTELGVIV